MKLICNCGNFVGHAVPLSDESESRTFAGKFVTCNQCQTIAYIEQAHIASYGDYQEE